jgi:hypothetical protein
MPLHKHTAHGSSEAGWSEAANEASKALHTKLKGQHKDVKFLAIRVVEFWAEPEPNPGSIQSFRATIEVTAEHP